MRNLDGPESGDEGAFGDSGVVPGHDAEQDDHRADVDEREREECQPYGAMVVLLGVMPWNHAGVTESPFVTTFRTI